MCRLRMDALLFVEHRTMIKVHTLATIVSLRVSVYTNERMCAKISSSVIHYYIIR